MLVGQGSKGNRAMKSYVMWYCRYNPDVYMGHRSHSFQALDDEDADKIAHSFLKGLTHLTKGKWEYILMKAVSGFRVYDTETEQRL